MTYMIPIGVRVKYTGPTSSKSSFYVGFVPANLSASEDAWEECAIPKKEEQMGYKRRDAYLAMQKKES